MVYQWTVPESLAGELPETTHGTGTVTVKVYSGGTPVGSLSAAFTAYVPETMRPTAALTVMPVNDNAVLEQWGVFVKGMTRLRWQVTTQGAYGSSIDGCSVSCGGVGDYAQCPASVAGALPGVGKEATIYTVMSITENDVSLYGFATEQQQACFEMLTAVSGVGPKVGLAILSVMEPDRVALAISAGDHKAFKAASGVGPKLAQRIVLELKDKVAKGFVDGISLEDVAGAFADTQASQGSSQAIAALVSLGYSQSEAALAVSKIDAALPVEEIIKLALRSMAGRR